MLRLVLLVMIGNLIHYKSVKAIQESEVDYLQENFFTNLRNDPRLQGDVLTKEKKDFIDEQINNFIRLTRKSQGAKKSGRQKRSFPVDEIESISRDKYGVYALDSVEAKFILETEFARDIVVFEQGNEWYAAALEGSEFSTYANKLRLYQKYNDSFYPINEVNVTNGLRLSLHTAPQGTFIAVAENRTENDPMSKLLLFQPDRSVKKVEMFNVSYVSDVIIWEQNNEIFMAACQQMQIKSNETSYEASTFVYKWLGKDFHAIQQFTTYNAQKIATFRIGNSHFLAVANNRNDRGESNVFSEVFKYDLEEQKFVPHQRIASKSANDVKFFGFAVEHIRESFLVIANYFDEECNEEASSIIYKYVDDYFIPFQSMEITAATGWLPVAGANGEFVLLASSANDGIKFFQYDGWRFVDSKMQYPYNIETFGPGVISMHSVIYNTKEILVVVSNRYNDGEQSEVFKLNFIHRNLLTDYHEKMLSWCKETLDSLHIEEVEKEIIVGRPGRSDMPDSSISPSDFFEELQGFNGSVIEEEDFDNRITTIESQLEFQSAILQNLDVALLQAMNPTFIGDVFARSVTVNSDVVVQDLSTRKLNNVTMGEFAGNLLKVTGFSTEEPLYFGDLTVTGSVNPISINQKPFAMLLHKTDDLHLNKLIVDGTVIFEKNIKVDGKVNNIAVTNRTILLNQGDQYIPGKLKVAQIKAQTLETPALNKMDLGILQYLSMKPLKLENIESLSVQRLTLNGVFNDVDMNVLNDFVLKTTGDQDISGTYIFDNLEVNNIKTSNMLSDNLIRVNDGEYWLKYDIQFRNSVIANNVKIKSSINHITVKSDGQLDVLLKNSSELQLMNGFKEVETVKLGDAAFRGKILSKLVENINPVKHIAKEVNVKGNYVFKKGVSVEKVLQIKDAANSEGTVSVQRLRNEGIKIYEQHIPTHLSFMQQMKVRNVSADKVNGRDAESFIVTGTHHLQIVNGTKLIPGDLSVTGSTEALNINNINLKELETTTVKINGDQVLTGKFTIENLQADSINTSLAQMRDKFWANVITTDRDQLVMGKTVLQTLRANYIEAISLLCVGPVNNFEFDDVVQDTIIRSNIIRINSHKHFINLTVDKLITKDSKQLEDIPNFQKLFESALLPNVEVENITFVGLCNGMTNKAFSDSWSLRFNEDLHFENITVAGALQIDSDSVNNLKMKDLVFNTVKRNEPFHFENATFDNVLYSAKPVILMGELKGVSLEDLSNIKYNNNQMKANVFNEINVNGSVFFGGLVTGANISELCSFAQDNNDNKRLIVEGSASVGNDLKAHRIINGYDVQKIKSRAWFKNKKALVSGYYTFNEMHFENEVSCSGYVGGINLNYLVNNYFSRTADQNISASIQFEDNIVFQNGVKAPTLRLVGDVNDLDLKEFLETALLDGMPQFFEQTVYLDECTIEGRLEGDYLVNNQNLQTDVMRYDQDNIVTGVKKLQNVITEKLKADERITVQGVSLQRWINASVLKTGGFNVTGFKHFNGFLEFKKGIHIHGPFNGVLLDKNHTVLNSLPQTITGRKTFVGAEQNPSVHFKNIILSGRINGINLNEMIDNQVYRNEDSTITSALNFTKDVSAVGVKFEKLYNGINVTDFVKKVTHFADLGDIEIAHLKLLDVAHSVEESLKAQAYYLSTYEIIKQFYHHTYDVVPVLFPDNTYRLAAVYKANETVLVNLYAWNSFEETFEKAPQQVQYLVDPFYTTALKYPDGDYFYIEGYSNNVEKEYLAVVSEFINDTSLTSTYLPIEQVRSVSTFMLPHSAEKCIVAVFLLETPVAVICNFYAAASTVLTIETSGAIKAITIVLEDVPHIITINSDLHREEPSVNLWKYVDGMHQFSLAQTMYFAQPNDVAVISYKNGYYLAISSGHVPEAMYTGSIEIYKYNSKSKQFGHYQTIQMNAPIQLEFAVLPSQELLLFVLTDNSIEPLIAYEYSGISGFTKKIVTSGIPRSISMRHFTTEDRQHFIVLRLVNDMILVLRAIFRGQLYEE